MAVRQRISRVSVVVQFVAALKEAVESGKVTVTQLAATTGLSRNHLYRLMRGDQAPTLDTAETIAKAIGMSIKIEA